LVDFQKSLDDVDEQANDFYSDLSESDETAISMERLIEEVLGSSSLVEQGLFK